MVWAKDRLPGLTPNCAVGTAWPVPDKVTTLSVTAGVVTTVPLLLVACPLMVKVADRAPVVEGVNARLIVQLFEPSTSKVPVVVDAVQVPPLTTWNSVDELVIAVNRSLMPPVLVTVTVCVDDALPTVDVPNDTAVGDGVVTAAM